TRKATYLVRYRDTGTASTTTETADMARKTQLIVLHSGQEGKLRQALQKANGEVPRYLFRGWNSYSGGDPRLNTTKAITAGAFLHAGYPTSIEDIPDDRLAALWNGHMGAHHTSTIFSSWSQFLNVALGYAFRGPDAHLSVIDTTKLGPHNTAVFTYGSHLTEVGLGGVAYEFLVFGVVSGDVLRSASCQELTLSGKLTSGPSTYMLGPHSVTEAVPNPDVDSELAATSCTVRRLTYARMNGHQYGADYDLVMACWFLTRSFLPAPEPPLEVIAYLASEYEVSREWLGDASAFGPGPHAPFADLLIVVQLMKSIAEHKYNRAVPRSKAMRSTFAEYSRDYDQAIAETEASKSSGATSEGKALDAGAPDSAFSYMYPGFAPATAPSPIETVKIPKGLEIDMKGWT
ncbi:hypothetical protein LTR53_017098, partial [Teratosphaeriaceae sp. CCFEE 6253]